MFGGGTLVWRWYPCLEVVPLVWRWYPFFGGGTLLFGGGTPCLVGLKANQEENREAILGGPVLEERQAHGLLCFEAIEFRQAQKESVTFCSVPGKVGMSRWCFTHGG